MKEHDLNLPWRAEARGSKYDILDGDGNVLLSGLGRKMAFHILKADRNPCVLCKAKTVVLAIVDSFFVAINNYK